jgi:ABC-type lipopolysaccharide export system ATPase subunit
MIGFEHSFTRKSTLLNAVIVRWEIRLILRDIHSASRLTSLRRLSELLLDLQLLSPEPMIRKRKKNEISGGKRKREEKNLHADASGHIG